MPLNVHVMLRVKSLSLELYLMMAAQTGNNIICICYVYNGNIMAVC